MIPVCFPQEVTLGHDDHTATTCLPFSPEVRGGTTVIDPHRVYLVMEETLQGVRADAMRSGKPQPVELKPEIFDMLPQRPLPLSDCLNAPFEERKASLRICLLNGGGGGLGDGILFAPALKILAGRLKEGFGLAAEMDVFTLYPLRTASVLRGIPNLRVKGSPLSLAEFTGYDVYADFSGMLQDPSFATTHMTDFALRRMGIDPDSVPADEKAPFLLLPPESPAEVQAALAMAKRTADGRPLVGVIFKSAYTRSMPDPQAAALIGRLAGAHLPVLLMENPETAAAFIRQFDLRGRVFDLSPVSSGLLHYFHLLAGLDAIVSVDTSAVHIGAGLRKPTVGIFNSIDNGLRIRYSPTVRGIQLNYQGRRCQAPCGLSKSRAYVEGWLPTGKPVHLDCGYACDEAVEKDAVLKEAIASLNQLSGDGSDAETLERIRHRMIDGLHAALAPCWSVLDLEEVAGLLQTVMDEGRKGDSPCPICGGLPPHTFVGEIPGQAACFACRTCQGSFCRPGRTGVLISGAEDPREVYPEEIRAVGAVFRAVASGAGRILAACDRRWHAAFEQWRQNHREIVHLSWPLPENFSHEHLEACQALVLLAALDEIPRPAEVLKRLTPLLSPEATVMLLSNNRQAWGQDAGDDGLSERLGLGWTGHTHQEFHRQIGLETLWTGTTPICRNTCQEKAGGLPPLKIQPPSRTDLTLQVGGGDLAGYVGGFMAQVLQNVSGNGRFVISIGQKMKRI